MNANYYSSFLPFSVCLILPIITHSISTISLDSFDPDAAANIIYKGDATVSGGVGAVGVNRVDYQCPLVRPPAVDDHDLVCLGSSSGFQIELYFTFVIDTNSYTQNDSFIIFVFLAQDHDSFNGDGVPSILPDLGKELISLSKMMTPTLIIALVTACFLFLVFDPHSKNARKAYVIVLVMVCLILLLLVLVLVAVVATVWTLLRKKTIGNNVAEQAAEQGPGRHIEGLPGRPFSSQEIFNATSGFADKRKLRSCWTGFSGGS